MKEETMKIATLAEILDMKAYTLRVYLSNYRFNKYITHIIEDSRKRLAYKINPTSSNELARILYMRKKWGSLKLWGDYCSKNFFNILDEEN